MKKQNETIKTQRHHLNSSESLRNFRQVVFLEKQ